MPRYKHDRTQKYVRYDSPRVEGKPTNRFILQYHYGNSASDDTYLLFRVYEQKLSANSKAAGISPFTHYAVEDFYTRIQANAEKKARKLIEDRFGKGMKLTIKGKDE